MYKKLVAILVIILVLIIAFFYGYFEVAKEYENKKPVIEITYPYSGATVSKIVTISGTASDPDGADTQLKVEIMIDDQWITADGNAKWSYEWITFDIEDGIYNIYVRAWDEIDYSVTENINRIQRKIKKTVEESNLFLKITVDKNVEGFITCTL